ncbi:hypothetical protein CTAYLR_009952 [Chrysophaeum taylorii]|uniref:RRM domain-containing protein n=1 Tax=Chrysophaeum taylorii TaxID=2483200 RepID=A0AAD7UK25_9STRA|nr:hypothetical protein CTAYLR_009952 [Chrysophaeum taylorii]
MRLLLLSTVCAFVPSTIHVREPQQTALNVWTKRNPKKKIAEKKFTSVVGQTLKRKNTIALPHRLFFANLPYDVEEDEIHHLFAKIGPVIRCKLMRDQYTGNSKGWGFVTFTHALHATNAKTSLDGFDVGGRPLKVDEATSVAEKRKAKKVAAAYAKREARRQAQRTAIEKQQGHSLEDHPPLRLADL